MTTEIVGSTVFVMSGGVLVKAPRALAESTPATSRGTNSDYVKTAKHVWWGENDDFPWLLQRDLRADTVLKPGIRLKAEMFYAGGLVYGKTIINAKGQRDWQYAIDKDVEAFMRKNFIAKQYYQIFYDLCTMQIAFPQFVLSKDKTKIVRLTTEFTMAAHCRFGRLVNGYPEVVYLNADFGTNEYKPENTREIKCAPQYDTVEWIRKNLKGGDRFILPISITDGFNQYYPEPDWNTARNSNWVQISKDIAVFNKALVNNKLTILHHIETHPDFWPSAFGEKKWNAADDKGKVELIKSWAESFAKTLKGAENVGNVITSDMGVSNSDTSKTYPLLKITKIDREIDFKEGAYLPTSKEASEHKVFSLGLHSDITGVTPGGGMGAGSGSNNRVAFNQRAMLAKAIQDMAARPMVIVQEYNGWNEDLEFTFETSLITTLDQGAETQINQPTA